MTQALIAVPRPASAEAAPRTAFHAFTLIGAAVAATATAFTLAFALPAWAMFLGWVGYSLSGATVREGAANLATFLLGLGFGIGTGFAIVALTPALGFAATPLAVLGIVILILSLRNLPAINNPAAYFLGAISFFASGQAPSAPLFVTLAAAGLIGAVGAGIASALQSRLPQSA